MRKLSSSALIVFGADAGARLLGFLASAHLARALDTGGFGLVVIGLSFLSYILWFADFGIGTLGIREMGRADRPEAGSVFAPSEILWVRLALGAAVTVVALVGVELVLPAGQLRGVMRGYVLGTIPFVLTLEWYFQGIQRYTPLIVSRTLTAAIYAGLLVLLVAQPGHVERVPMIFVASNLVPALLLFAFKRRGDSFAPRAGTFARAGLLLRGAGMIGVGAIFAQTVQQLPPLVLGAYSTEQAGLLGAALRIVAVVMIVDRVFAVLFLPAITRLIAADRARAADALEHVLALVTGVGVALAVPITVGSPVIMRLVFGEPFVAGAGALTITIWFAAATLVNSVFVYGLIGAGHERAYLRASALGAALTVVLTVILVHFFGITGAAVAMTLSEVGITLLTGWQFRHVLPVRPLRPILAAVPVAALLVWGSFALGLAHDLPSLLWQGPLLALAVVGLMLLVGGIRRNDIQWVMRR